jgi:hypothetical protein
VKPRCWLCGLLAVLCAGCGGGSPAEPPAAPAPRVIEFYGDSLTFGSIEGPAGTLTRLAVPPVRRAQELLGTSALCVDLSLPGATVADALAGVAMMPFGRFAEHVAKPRRPACWSSATAGPTPCAPCRWPTSSATWPPWWPWHSPPASACCLWA